MERKETPAAERGIRPAKSGGRTAGIRPLVFGCMSLVPRLLAWLPLGIGRGLAWAAEWCEREARR